MSQGPIQHESLELEFERIESIGATDSGVCIVFGVGGTYSLFIAFPSRLGFKASRLVHNNYHRLMCRTLES